MMKIQNRVFFEARRIDVINIINLKYIIIL
jgi:hypothetical protein